MSDLLPSSQPSLSGAPGIVILLPVVLSDEGYGAIPEILRAEAESCDDFFVEELRTARRFLRRLIPGFDIDGRTWWQIDLRSPEMLNAFRSSLLAGRTIGIMSEAGCPGIADPGQELVALAQGMGARVRPVTGPSSIFLALMASGMNGQLFRFNGYLPVESDRRKRSIRELESDSARTGCTHIFIETPYRNDALLDAILSACRPDTRLCIAIDITGRSEDIRTRRVADWQRDKPNMHKVPTIFLLSA
ncbi:MAG: SAM-dependent methyltransferase [bacterium]|jgi:16S rRNA (cytidine1402-2'-O)-methyltransferase|nr:SAM-dependent methyltransferase [Chitinophagaceae bacterium]